MLSSLVRFGSVRFSCDLDLHFVAMSGDFLFGFFSLSHVNEFTRSGHFLLSPKMNLKLGNIFCFRARSVFYFHFRLIALAYSFSVSVSVSVSVFLSHTIFIHLID